MRRIVRIVGILSIISLIALELWGEQIREFSIVLYLLMFLTIPIGCVGILILMDRDTDRRIAEQAVARYKKANGISE